MPWVRLTVLVACLNTVYLYYLCTAFRAYLRGEVYLHFPAVHACLVFFLLTVVSHAALAYIVSVLAPLLVSAPCSTCSTGTFKVLFLLHGVLYPCKEVKVSLCCIYRLFLLCLCLDNVGIVSGIVYLYLFGFLQSGLRLFYLPVDYLVGILAE